MHPGLLHLKQGATLSLDLLITDDLGNPVTLTAATVSLLVCDAYGNAVATLAISPSASTGWATVTADTTLWPLGRLAAEVHVVASGATTISDTFFITIDRPVSA